MMIKTKRGPKELNEAQVAALQEFQELVGADWKRAVHLFNLGQVGAVHGLYLHRSDTDFVAYLRQIRNGVTADPSELPDMRQSEQQARGEATADPVKRPGEAY